MRRLAALVAASGVLAVASYVVVNHTCGSASECDCTSWLRETYGVDAATCRRILQSQREFARACHGHCREVVEARAAWAAEAEGTPARATAAQAVANAERHCLEARIEQARRIAAMLPESQRQKYLDLVLPRLHALDHEGAPGVTGTR